MLLNECVCVCGGGVLYSGDLSELVFGPAGGRYPVILTDVGIRNLLEIGQHLNTSSSNYPIDAFCCHICYG